MREIKDDGQLSSPVLGEPVYQAGLCSHWFCQEQSHMGQGSHCVFTHNWLLGSYGVQLDSM